MQTRHRFKQTTTLEQRLTEHAERSRAEAKGVPPGIEREKLVRKARQAETALQINAWVDSKGLRPPS